jgi:hypothetical protein
LSTSDLLELLQKLETDLHQLETRGDKSRLEELLHPGFREIGRSGREFTRREVIDEISDGTEYPSVVAEEFELRSISDAVALLTYRSAHVGQSGRLHRHTLRSSLWVRGPSGWQMYFHQGTPADE